jgi:hypothetical protein
MLQGMPKNATAKDVKNALWHQFFFSEEDRPLPDKLPGHLEAKMARENAKNEKENPHHESLAPGNRHGLGPHDDTRWAGPKPAALKPDFYLSGRTKQALGSQDEEPPSRRRTQTAVGLGQSGYVDAHMGSCECGASGVLTDKSRVSTTNCTGTVMYHQTAHEMCEAPDCCSMWALVPTDSGPIYTHCA